MTSEVNERDAADPSRGDTQTTVNCRERAIALIDPAVRGRQVASIDMDRFGGAAIDPAYIFEQTGS